MPSADVVDLVEVARRVMAENGFAADFPAEAVREAEAQPEAPPDHRGVMDLRALPWSSIDNRESRDLDQAEVVEALPRDILRVRIAIADVHARVAEGTAVDGHASTNTTSVYAGVTVFPMLPERLSTDLTSLNPGEDRLAMVVDIDVGPTGRVFRESVSRAVVTNHAKLDYDGVGLWLEGHGPAPPETTGRPELEEQIQLQDEAARRLIALRRREGLLDFDTLEPRPVVANGRVVDIQMAPQNRARDIIESFMVAANSALARFLESRGRSAIRRVVREPKRWDRIVALAHEVGDLLPVEPDRRALAGFPRPEAQVGSRPLSRPLAGRGQDARRGRVRAGAPARRPRRYQPLQPGRGGLRARDGPQPPVRRPRAAAPRGRHPRRARGAI